VEPVLRAPFYLEVLLTIAEDTGVWQGCLLGDFGKCFAGEKEKLVMHSSGVAGEN
jgi:hypothetical protein